MQHTAIAEVGNFLVKRLRAYMVPETLMNPDQIGLCSPEERGDLVLGLYLYDIRESDEIRDASLIALDASRQRYPSSYLNLYYMVTAYSKGDLKYRAEEEQKLLGRVVQVFASYPTLDELSGAGETAGAPVVPAIVMQNLSLEDKLRIWTVPNVSYRTSLFYRVGPVEIESERVRKIGRVTSAEFKMEQMPDGAAPRERETGAADGG